MKKMKVKKVTMSLHIRDHRKRRTFFVIFLVVFACLFSYSYLFFDFEGEVVGFKKVLGAIKFSIIYMYVLIMVLPLFFRVAFSWGFLILYAAFTFFSLSGLYYSYEDGSVRLMAVFKAAWVDILDILHLCAPVFLISTVVGVLLRRKF
ncbi:hypothetical protein [Thalassovita sp.]|uniref:hypothetical protein n=1 Tax=Thalassovita sp. TaxID=1979401 RepID=UPI002B269759|nr:hypothetical protein [Thalassovita sp.]